MTCRKPLQISPDSQTHRKLTTSRQQQLTKNWPKLTYKHMQAKLSASAKQIKREINERKKKRNSLNLRARICDEFCWNSRAKLAATKQQFSENNAEFLELQICCLYFSRALFANKLQRANRG